MSKRISGFYIGVRRQVKISKTQENRFYIYIHRRLSDDKVFYVGKGSGNRAWVDTGRNVYWKRTAEKHDYYVEIVFEQLFNEDAYLTEIDVIKEFRYFNEPLTNLTDGGEGGKNPSEETRLKMSIAKKGKSPHNKGKKFPEFSGLNSACSDKNLYRFKHDDGTVLDCTRHDIIEKYNLNSKPFGKLFYKTDPRKKIFGWQILEKLTND